jgi:NADPH2:quinone reductase
VKAVDASHAVVVHAASGSTGRLLSQWANHLGARVVGTVTKAEKAACTAGCDAVFLNTDPGWVEATRAFLGGGADLVCDSIGKPTFLASLEVAAKRGHVALYGQAGGVVESIPVAPLAAKSLTVSRPIVFDWHPSPWAETMARQFYDLVEQGALSIEAPQVLALDQVAEAQRMLQDSGLNGPLVLRPEES